MTTSLTSRAQAPAPSRPGSVWARALRALRRGLQASANARAETELRALARGCESLQPERAKELRHAWRARGAA